MAINTRPKTVEYTLSLKFYDEREHDPDCDVEACTAGVLDELLRWLREDCAAEVTVDAHVVDGVRCEGEH